MCTSDGQGIKRKVTRRNHCVRDSTDVRPNYIPLVKPVGVANTSLVTCVWRGVIGGPYYIVRGLPWVTVHPPPPPPPQGSTTMVWFCRQEGKDHESRCQHCVNIMRHLILGQFLSKMTKNANFWGFLYRIFIFWDREVRLGTSLLQVLKMRYEC